MKKNGSNKYRAVAVIVLAFTFAFAQAAFCQSKEDYQESLFRFAPKDAAAAIQIKDISKSYDDLLASSFYQNITQTNFYTEWTLTENYAKMQQDKLNFQAQQGISIENFLLNMFGSEVLIIYRPVSGLPLREGSGALLARAIDAATLKNQVDLINEMERNDGKLISLTEESYEGVTIYKKIKFAKAPKSEGKTVDSMIEKTEYYALLGEIFAISNQANLLKEVIDIHASRTKEALIDSPNFMSTISKAPEESFAVLYLDMADIRDAIPEPGYQNPGVRLFAGGIRQRIEAIQQMAVSARIKEGLVIESFQKYDSGQLDPDLHKALISSRGPVRAIDYVTDDAVVFCSFKIDCESIWKYALKNMNEAQQLKAQNLLRVWNAMLQKPQGTDENPLTGLGPEVSLLISGKQEGSAVKPQGILFVEVKPDEIPRYQAVLNVLLTLAGNPLGENEPEIEFSTETYGNHTLSVIKPLKGNLAGKVTPAFCFSSGLLMVATSPDFLKSCLDAQHKPLQVFDTEEVAELKSPDNEEKSVVLINAGNLRRLAEAHKSKMIENSVKKGTPLEKAQKDIANLLDIIGLFDTCTMTNKVNVATAERAVHIKTR